jgi:hypothetical protein
MCFLQLCCQTLRSCAIFSNKRQQVLSGNGPWFYISVSPKFQPSLPVLVILVSVSAKWSNIYQSIFKNKNIFIIWMQMYFRNIWNKIDRSNYFVFYRNHWNSMRFHWKWFPCKWNGQSHVLTAPLLAMSRETDTEEEAEEVRSTSTYLRTQLKANQTGWAGIEARRDKLLQTPVYYYSW